MSILREGMFRVRVFKNSACELHFLVGPEQSTDRIVYGELIHAARVTWKPGGQIKFVYLLAMLSKAQQ